MDLQINSSYHAPLSPRQNNCSSNPNTGIGQKLFDGTSDFYAWYLSWDSTPKAHSNSFRLLSQIMRIAQVSLEGGNFVSSNEEALALHALSRLREHLFDGLAKTDEIHEKLKEILQLLTNQNAKSRLVAHATELEYVFCIHPSEQAQTENKYFRDYLNAVLKNVNPSLLEIHAYAIAQSMAKLLENANSVYDPQEVLHKEISRWIN